MQGIDFVSLMKDALNATLHDRAAHAISPSADATKGSSSMGGSLSRAFGTLTSLVSAAGNLEKAGNSAKEAIDKMAESLKAAVTQINHLSKAIGGMEGPEKAPAAGHGGKGRLKKLALGGGKLALKGIAGFGKLELKGIAEVAKLGIGGLEKGAGFLIDKAPEMKKMGIEASKTHNEFRDQAGEKAGDKLYNDVGKLIKGSVLGPEAYKDAGTLLKSDVAPGKVMGYMKQLGDVSNGDTENMHNLTNAFGDTRKEGRLTRKNLDKFTEAGFDPLEEMSRTSGKSMANLRDDMDKGKISSAMVSDALKSATGEGGAYHDGLDKAGMTTEGKEERVQNHLQMAEQGVGEAMMPAYDKILTALQPVIDGLPAMVGMLSPYFDQLAGALVELLPGLQKFGGAVLALLKPFSDVLMGDSMKAFAKNVVDVATKIAEFLMPVLEHLKPVANFMIDVASLFVSLLGKLADAGKWLFGKIDSPRAVDEHPKSMNDPNALAAQPFLAGKDLKLPMPKATNPEPTAMNPPKPKTDTKTVEEASSGITGGGGKQIIINVNKPFYNVESQVFQNVADHIKDLEPKVQELFLRILQSANAAIG